MEKSKKILKSVGKWFGIALNVVLILIILLNVYTIAMRAITKKEVVSVFGFSSALVDTGSMSGDQDDSIEGFTMIFMVKSREYKIGDIITFDTGGRVPTTHRIVGVDDEGFITKGDFNTHNDGERVKPKQIIGKVFFTIPNVGYFVKFMKTPFGMLILVLVCFLLIYAPSFLKPIKKKDADGGGDNNDSKTTTELESETEEKNTESQ